MDKFIELTLPTKFILSHIAPREKRLSWRPPFLRDPKIFSIKIDCQDDRFIEVSRDSSESEFEITLYCLEMKFRFDGEGMQDYEGYDDLTSIRKVFPMGTFVLEDDRNEDVYHLRIKIENVRKPKIWIDPRNHQE